MAEKILSTGLRLTAALHARLSAEAQRNHRSLNAEILWRLERSFEEPEAHMEDGS